MRAASIAQQNTPTSIVIRVFGSFEILVDGQPLGYRTPGDLKLLAYMILHREHPTPRARLIKVGWSQLATIDQQQKSRLLSRSLSMLRKGLIADAWRLRKSEAQSNGLAYEFDVNGTDLDLLAWETILGGGLHTLESGGSFFRSKVLLEGWDDAWVLEARQRIHSDYLDALKFAAARASDHGQWDTAIRCFELIFDIDPWHRDCVCCWLDLLFERRRFAAMARLYDDFIARSLDARRNVDAGVAEHYRRLRYRMEQFKASNANGWLPNLLSSFVPRPADVNEIGKIVRNARLTTLVGSAGIGKTRLAIATASELRDLFFDRAWFADFSELSSTDSVWEEVATALRLEKRANKTTVDLVCEWLQGREALLVLDNCEHLLDACIQVVQKVLERCPDVKILATSREAFKIPGEQEWRVPALDYPQPSASYLPAEIERCGAVRLLMERASRPQMPFSIDTGNVGAVASICQRLEGIPLAIELAAVQIHRQFHPAQEVAESLKQSFQSLTAMSRSVPYRQQTLWATIEWSYQLLTDTEQ